MAILYPLAPLGKTEIVFSCGRTPTLPSVRSASKTRKKFVDVVGGVTPVGNEVPVYPPRAPADRADGRRAEGVRPLIFQGFFPRGRMAYCLQTRPKETPGSVVRFRLLSSFAPFITYRLKYLYNYISIQGRAGGAYTYTDIYTYTTEGEAGRDRKPARLRGRYTGRGEAGRRSRDHGARPKTGRTRDGTRDGGIYPVSDRGTAAPCSWLFLAENNYTLFIA